MHRIKIIRTLIIVITTSLWIQTKLRAQESVKTDGKLEVEFSTGYMKQDLTWSIAGNLNGQNPNIYSELVWRDVGAIQFELGGRYNFWKKFILNVDANYALTQSGAVTDSDYESDNRTKRVFFAKLNSDKGSSYSIDPSIGYRLNISSKIMLTSSLGYGVSAQKLYLLDDIDLKSTYSTRWRGPFLKGSANFSFSNKVDTQLDFSYHQVNYKAEANWNLVETFKHPVSFEHTAKGYGITGDLKIGYRLTQQVKATISSGYFYWTTGAGVDALFLSDGTVSKTRLNDVTRNGFDVQIGIQWRMN
jgi:hypothetical protein